MADHAERRAVIVAGLDAAAEAAGAGWRDPGGKLDEVVFLVEWPSVLTGSIAEEHMRLPARVLVTAMQSHQRYFPLSDGDGALRPAFLAVSNGDPGQAELITRGNEDVLDARLQDAAFSYDRDREAGLAALDARLDAITFHQRLGSMAQKRDRLVEGVAALASRVGADPAVAVRAAALAKADQGAVLVAEFADLQGYVAAEYALLEGHPPAVAQAIEEQYLPEGPDSPLPASEAGALLAAAEKVDNLVGAFAVDEVPSGSKDPYGLRRAAAGPGADPARPRLGRGPGGPVHRRLPSLRGAGREPRGARSSPRPCAWSRSSATGSSTSSGSRASARRRWRRRAARQSAGSRARRPGPGPSRRRAAPRSSRRPGRRQPACSAWPRRAPADVPAEHVSAGDRRGGRARRGPAGGGAGHRGGARPAGLRGGAGGRGRPGAGGRPLLHGRAGQRRGPGHAGAAVRAGAGGGADAHPSGRLRRGDSTWGRDMSSSAVGVTMVYDFAEGSRDMRDLLGGKGANLAEMTRLGLPVPRGFTITTEACMAFLGNQKAFPEGLDAEIDEHLARLEEQVGKRLGDPENPLLVSVRSGAKFSMPGMMDTVLNLGLNDETVEGLAARTGNPRFACDSYRRFIQMFGDVVVGVEKAHFEDALTALKAARGAEQDTDLTADDLRELAGTFAAPLPRAPRRAVPPGPPRAARRGHPGRVRVVGQPARAGLPAPQRHPGRSGHGGQRAADGVRQHRRAVGHRRRLHAQPLHRRAGKPFGEFLINAQGEDVVAGVRTPRPLRSWAPTCPRPTRS